jgi:cell division protein FtsW (lipid II flippase)
MKWLLLLLFSQFADVVTTGFLIYRGGWETNPVALAIVHSGGILPLLLTKMALVVLAGLLMCRAARYGQRFARFVELVVCGIAIAFFVGSGWNLLVAITV